MKPFAGPLLVLSAILAATTAYGANLSGIEVLAKAKASGQVVYQGKTNAAGKFTTGSLAPGSYIMEFRSKDGQAFQVALTGPKQATQTKLAGGVAFDVEISPAAKVGGTVTGAQVLTAQQPAPKGTSKVKIMNGKRYVWVGPELGSHMGGKWVPEEDLRAGDPNARRNSQSALRGLQDRGQNAMDRGR